MELYDYDDDNIFFGCCFLFSLLATLIAFDSPLTKQTLTLAVGAHMEIGRDVQPAVAKVYVIGIDSVIRHHHVMELNFVR